MSISHCVGADDHGYPKMNAHKSHVDTKFLDADVLRAFIAENSPLQASNFDPGEYAIRN